MKRLLELPPEAFAERLADAGRRACIVRDEDGEPRASAPWLDELADLLRSDTRDDHGHEAVFFEVGRETGALHSAAVHCTTRGQAAGGVRLWPYPTLEAQLRDGLRLSLGMTRKNALAGLWWGGGKGVIARQPGDRWRDPDYRTQLYREYGELVSSLRGCYVTAEDAGTTPADLATVFSVTRHTTCIPPAFGGSGNPSAPTARGVLCAIEGALDELGRGSIEGKVFVMQGAGNVAGFMIDGLLERGAARVVASEVSPERAAGVQARYPRTRVEVRAVEPDDLSIFEVPGDVFVPNALGGCLSPETIERLRVGLVCGAANNQLLDDRRDDALLADREIVYVPDFLANRMGIVSCADEGCGVIPHDPAVERHLGREWENGIYRLTRRVLADARREGITPSAAASRLADALAAESHPLWPGRGQQIVRSLVESRWHEQAGHDGSASR